MRPFPSEPNSQLVGTWERRVSQMPVYLLKSQAILKTQTVVNFVQLRHQVLPRRTSFSHCAYDAHIPALHFLSFLSGPPLLISSGLREKQGVARPLGTLEDR
jgi:hypothetical protein